MCLGQYGISFQVCLKKSVEVPIGRGTLKVARATVTILKLSAVVFLHLGSCALFILLLLVNLLRAVNNRYTMATMTL